MNNKINNATIQDIDDKLHIYYNGYWIRYYLPPAESLGAKKILLDALTRRTFHHTETGINTPGYKLEQTRQAWEQEHCPHRKRVNAAMLAGALFNRATDIFTTIVELEQNGIKVASDNQLMRQCSDCFSEALELCHNVKHHSGEEGVDELWGEPVKVFTLSINEYYTSRYIKISQAMCAIDKIAQKLHNIISNRPYFSGAEKYIDALTESAKRESEILRSDPDHLKIWPHFVSAGENLHAFKADIPTGTKRHLERQIKRGTRLLHDGQKLISWIANVRVPMPKSTIKFFTRCDHFNEQFKLLPPNDSSKF